MDLVNGLLNIFAPIISFNAFLFFLPAYFCFKSAHYIWRSVFSENVAGKVVVIAGASSGMGEHITYEYARRGAYLVIGARRENALREVAENARWFGAPHAIPIRTDVTKVEDCRRLIETTINHFGRLDHIVLAAGVASVSMFEDAYDISNFAHVMDTNFWGLVYTTYFAAPHLRKTKGRIVVMASSISWLNEPRLSLIAASKAAVVSFFETLRVEFGSDIDITIVFPGVIESEKTKGKSLNKDGKLVVDQETRDVVLGAVPMVSVKQAAKTIVNSACHGDKYLTVPSWFSTTFFVKMLCPEAMDWFLRWFCVTEHGVPPREAISKKCINLPGMKEILWQNSVRSPKIKSN